jgi:copper chaperone CopZ
MDHQCQLEPLVKELDPDEAARKGAAIFAVWGMGCPNCAIRVQNGLISTRGVLDAHVDHLTGMAWVVFNPDLVNTSTLIAAVASAGNDGRHEYIAGLIAL